MTQKYNKYPPSSPPWRLVMILLSIALVVLVLAKTGNASTKSTICQVFKSHCREAIAVAKCESNLKTWAVNGQYLGLFQMGYWERRTYGHGSTAMAQARAAHRYFVASGRDWSPWSCKPW